MSSKRIMGILVPVVLIAISIWVYFRFVSPGKVTRVEDMQELVGRLDTFHKEIDEREGKIAEVIRAFNASRPEGERIDLETSKRLQLKELEQQILEKMLKGEEDVSYQGLLEKIGKQSEEIDRLNQQITDIETRLPAPYEVKGKKETHDAISVRYLTEEKGLSKEKAKELVNKTALVENLVPGFQVWMMYDEKADMFGSFVTQGTAHVSPRYVQRKAKQALMKRITVAEKRERERAQEVEQKTSEVEQLKAGVDSLKMVQESLAREREEARRQAEEAERERKRAEQELNTVYYTVNTMEWFKKQGVIRDPKFGGPRLETLSGVVFDGMIDVREDETILIRKRGVDRIDEVNVFPTTLRREGDYRIEYGADRSYATVRLLDKDAFLQAKRIIVAFK
ncbi:MAG: hypothetical protein HY709_08945 [Candidatus Latescibacteria bacterium]|nr:hypothetical protein [Candidatus Latescibacterota bacterium]